MSKISCDTCLDLIPLVKDGVSSQDSRKLVEDHKRLVQNVGKFTWKANK